MYLVERTFEPDSPEVEKLRSACKELARLSPYGTTYTVETIYFDYGQNWWWTTIVAYHRNGSSWQINSADWEKILLSEDIRATCAEIVSGKYWYDPAY